MRQKPNMDMGCGFGMLQAELSSAWPCETAFTSQIVNQAVFSAAEYCHRTSRPIVIVP
jgi:hypothetical protein